MSSSDDGHARENRGPQLLGVNSAAIVIATITMALRCYVRIHLVKGFGLDDWLMMTALVTFILYITFSQTGVTYGTGQHVWDLSPENNATAKKWWYGCYLTYALTAIFAKSSIALFLLRVAVNRVHRWIIYAVWLTTIVSCIIFFFACAFQCSPASYFWDKYTQDGTCLNDTLVLALAYLFSAINVITDFTFALLPAWIVSHLHMKLKTKFALIGLMGVGCIASAAVVVRLPFLPKIHDEDFLYETVDVAIWSTIELCLGITAASAATLQPLAKQVGYKFGLTSKPGLAGSSRLTDNFQMGNSISVRREITHKTEVVYPPVREQHEDEHGLKLEPGTSGYSAMCYNTSREELTWQQSTPGSNHDGHTTSKESDGETINFLPVQGGYPGAVGGRFMDGSEKR